MKRSRFIIIVFQCAFLFCLTCVTVVGFPQAPVSTANQASDTNKIKQPKNSFYDHLKLHPEFDTKIYGKVTKPNKLATAQLYPKGALFGDTVYNISNGSSIALLNTKLPLNKEAHRILVKITANPPKEEHTGKIGWMIIDDTSLYPYLDENNQEVDTNKIRKKYLAGAEKLREEAQKTKCPENKSCKLQWAKYYDCMAKGAHYDQTPDCKLADCEVKDCPEDK